MKIGIIVLLVVVTVVLALTVVKATKNHISCQTQVTAATFATYFDPGADVKRNKAIDDAWASYDCKANKTFGSLVRSLAK